MVQFLLRTERGKKRAIALSLATACLLVPAVGAAPKAKNPPALPPHWTLSLEGGRKLLWEQTFSSEKDVRGKGGFWTKLVDIIAGEPEYHTMQRPYSVVTDSRGRIIVSDPGAGGIHIFDFALHKYKFLERTGKNPMRMPQCVAVDAQDNIYATDSLSGAIFVFEPSGKFQRAIGILKGGEGFFKRPTGIAVDSAAQRIYVTDTLRDKVFTLDMQGDVLGSFGKEGMGDGEFNLPTELRMAGSNLMVVDAMNFRVQVLDPSGVMQYSIGKLGDEAGAVFRPKAIGMDSEGHLYIVDAEWGVVQVFDRQGQLLYYFGAKGTFAGQFQLPTGLFIDKADRIYVADSFNQRVQVFHYFGLSEPTRGAKQ